MSCARVAALALCVFCLPLANGRESFAGFDAAVASSVYSNGFSAGEALARGTGYWLRCGPLALRRFVSRVFSSVTVLEAMVPARLSRGQES